jgi:hypothetical protein
MESRSTVVVGLCIAAAGGALAKRCCLCRLLRGFRRFGRAVGIGLRVAPSQRSSGRRVTRVALPVRALLHRVQMLMAEVALDATLAVRADAVVAADQISAHSAPATLHLVTVRLNVPVRRVKRAWRCDTKDARRNCGGGVGRTSTSKTRVSRSRHLSQSNTASFGWSRGAPSSSASASQPQAVHLPSGVVSVGCCEAFGGLGGPLPQFARPLAADRSGSCGGTEDDADGGGQ